MKRGPKGRTLNLMDQMVCDIKLKGFENIDIKKILTIFDETYNDDLLLRKEIKRYFNSRWYDRYEYQYKESEGNRLIAFYSDYYYRKDHVLIFSNFIKEFPEFDYVMPVKLPEERRNILRGIKMLGWDVGNWWLFKNVNMQFKKKLSLIRVLGLVRLYCLKMGKYLDTKAYSFGMVYSDSNPYENALTQFMKRRGIHTATMQHGLFDKHGLWKGIEYRTSVADDWLAWNAYSKELAVECGIPEKNVKVLGIPRYIYPVEIRKESNRGIFCVVLGSKKSDEENQKLIYFANLLAGEKGWKYFLRCHPTCKESEYDSFIDKQLCIKRNGQEESVDQMCEQSDFCLVGSGTSMVIDLIYLKQPFIQYYDQWDGKECRGRKNYFRNEEGLMEQVGKEFMLPNGEVFSYYCTTMKVKESYNQYFSSVS